MGWLRPFVFLSSNWVSLMGVTLVTTSAVLWIALLPVLVRGTMENPYYGILIFLILPAGFFLGLALIPVGVLLRARYHRRRGTYPALFQPLNIQNPELRRLVTFIALTTGANVIIAGQLSYSAVNYMDSVAFCGQTCHTVMKPEFTAYQNSPHSRVECVKCHIGPGASWFVKSKLSGAYQVYAVTFNRYARPIPAPVANLRPARETCEACHWPQQYGGDRLKVIPKFADDEANTPAKTVLLMHIGGGASGPGIHGVHLGAGVRVRYAHADSSRQTIPWVEYSNGRDKPMVYTTADAKPDDAGSLPVRVMDCMDCHNRPTHTFELPERAVDGALASGRIDAALPFAKKQSVEILKANFANNADAGREIVARFTAFYREKYSSVYAARASGVESSAREVAAIHARNVFPEMNVSWGVYPNNIGHVDFPGCFRCHDDNHSSATGKKISQDCESCHSMLAVEDPSPKILRDLGVAQ